MYQGTLADQELLVTWHRVWRACPVIGHWSSVLPVTLARYRYTLNDKVLSETLNVLSV